MALIRRRSVWAVFSVGVLVGMILTVVVPRYEQDALAARTSIASLQSEIAANKNAILSNDAAIIIVGGQVARNTLAIEGDEDLVADLLARIEGAEILIEELQLDVIFLEFIHGGPAP